MPRRLVIMDARNEWHDTNVEDRGDWYMVSN